MKTSKDILTSLAIDWETFLKDPITTALQMIQAGIDADKWISVNDAKPEDFNEVLVQYRYGEVPVQARWSGYAWIMSMVVYDSVSSCSIANSELLFQEDITHWQALPTPPKKA